MNKDPGKIEPIDYTSLAIRRATELGKVGLVSVLQGEDSADPKDTFVKGMLAEIANAASLPNKSFGVVQRNRDEFTKGVVVELYDVLGADAPEFTVTDDDGTERHERIVTIPGGSLEEVVFDSPFGGYHGLTFIRTEATPPPAPSA
ncbi:MAG TPA: hypothetical protein VLF43_02595 [Candidatus Saccharimonadales bacterium]|nr:hypothetical protein [Candidatus Saccharimonadales bacterium]